MTDKTDIKALRPSERAKLGFVTDDNTGGYYVAECEECGQIFPSQTCDGGGQIADSGDYGDCYCPHCGFIDPLECDNANLVWNVQQLKIVNLTKQLEAERQTREAFESAAFAMRDEMREQRKRAEKAELELIKPLPIGELIQRLEGQTYEKWFSQSDLKGDQVPVAIKAAGYVQSIATGTDTFFLKAYYGHGISVGDRIFTVPQKPVALPQAFAVRPGVTLSGDERNVMIPKDNGNWLSKLDVEHAIKMAGGIVKDGE